ncbi:MAG TPA: flagellar basal-body MS-ring/collar protein FliF [Burkholderiaceae bacterium]|nr:flagellar basal-body MS-ring/collar protein FliF [Burkholderiaceae bacterium]
MSTAVAEIDAPPPAPGNPLLDGIKRLNTGQKVRVVAGVAILLAIVIASLFMGKQAEWRVLFSNLNDKDGGAIVAQLTTMNIPYKYTEGGGAILVPAEKVHDVRLRLASQGLPKGSVGGFEMMEANRFGMTQFQERLTFQRGLEGELTRSVQSIAAVQSARIHLALPNQNGFFREQQKPSASVLVTLHPGRSLDKAQVAGIVHLVAASVPEMTTKAVSVVDDAGNLLSNPPDGQQNGIDTQKLQYVAKLEESYTRRVMDILEPLLGKENVRAQVTADVDFSLSEQTSESHGPNQGGSPSSVRSQQLVEANTDTEGSTPGAPGAVSNIPPGPSAAPINGQAVAPGVTGPNGAGATNSANTRRRESVVNYEVDKTVRVVKGTSGNVKRLTAAVVINHRMVADPKTGKESPQALPPEQIEQMTALVREAIGFNKDRGDSVNLMNAPFTLTKVETVEVPIWKQPENVEIARTFAWPLAAVVLGLIVLLGLIRPTVKAATAPPPAPAELTALTSAEGGAAGQLQAVVGNESERGELMPGLAGPADDPGQTEHQLRLDDARRLAKENPVAVAEIIKGWVNGEGG